MSRRAVVFLLLGQTVLLVLFGWTAAYLGRDEFRLAAAPDSGAVPSRAAPTADEPGGLPAVRIGVAAQRSVGIEVALGTVAGAAAAGSTTNLLTAVVVDLQPLLELQARLRAADLDMTASRAAARASAVERRRVQALYDDDRNASQRSLDTAVAQADADAARERGGVLAQAALRAGARAAWGQALADALAAATPPPLLARVLSGHDVLLRTALRPDDTAPAPAHVDVGLPGGTTTSVAARLLATVPPTASTDGMVGGRNLLYVAPAAGLAPGMRLAISARREVAAAAPLSAVLVPLASVVWHAGQPWVYVRDTGSAAAEPAATAKDDDDDARKPAAADPPAQAASATAAVDTFRRHAVPAAERQGTQWLLPGFDAKQPVVVRGAQVLLSEELKSQIRDENDD